MAVHTFEGKPGVGMSLRSDGRCMMDVRFSVERRCGSKQIAGHWCDVWSRDGDPHTNTNFAAEHAARLRAEGFTVRVRPVVL